MPAQNPNANRSESVKPKPAKKKLVKKPPASPDQADRTQQQTQPTRRKPASQDHYRAPEEQQYVSQAHSVRLRASDRRGHTPSGDRPQGREQEMRANSRKTAAEDSFSSYTPIVETHISGAGPDVKRVKLGSSPSGDRPQGRAAEMRSAPTHAKMRKGGGGPLFAVVRIPKAYVGALAGANVDPTGLAPGAQLVKNAVSDAAELAVTTPTSVAKLAVTAATDPKKVPGMLAQPYKNFAKDPGRTAFEHPISTALMVQPAVRVPGRVVGKVARVAGKQTLERPAATLPDTALKQARTGSRDAAVRMKQARTDRKNPNPVMSDSEIARRTDEFYGTGQQHTQNVAGAAARQVKERGLTGDAAIEHVRLAYHGAQHAIDKRFVEELGAVQRIGRGVQPKASKGVLHDTHADARRVADRLNAKGSTEFVVHQAGDKYGVVPKLAADRLGHHRRVGNEGAMMARVLRVSRKAFTQAVLPTSPKWLTGQAVEAALRSVVSGSGPTSYLRARRVVKELDRQQPGAGQALLGRATPGGLIGRTATREVSPKTISDEFAGTALAQIAHAITKAGGKPGPKQIRGAYRGLTNFVYHSLNGRIEGVTQTAMLGKALKNSPLMERSIIGLSDKAVHDAARGLHNTENQVALARAVQRMYGKYANFSPEVRSLIMHWTPFQAWTGNVIRFLGDVLPRDHPVISALIADATSATEEWRKQHRLSLHDSHVKPFLMGSYPKGDKFVKLARYTPFGIGEDVSGSLAGLVMPQFDSAQMAARGLDWTGKPLNGKHSADDVTQGERAVAFASALVESMIPGVSIGENIRRNIKRGDKTTVALRKQFDPFKSTGAPATSKGSGTVVGRVKLNGTDTRVTVPKIKLN